MYKNTIQMKITFLAIYLCLCILGESKRSLLKWLNIFEKKVFKVFKAIFAIFYQILIMLTEATWEKFMICYQFCHRKRSEPQVLFWQ